MKKNIHPPYYDATVQCGGCGSEWKVGSTLESISVNVCSVCHPFYTGDQKILDAEGRVDRFNRKYSKFNAAVSAPESSTKTKRAPASVKL